MLLLFLDELALDQDLDLIADDPLAIEQHVERHAEVLPIDLALGAVAYAVTHHGIIKFPIIGLIHTLTLLPNCQRMYKQGNFLVG